MADSLALVAVSDDRRYAVFSSSDKLVRVDTTSLRSETFSADQRAHVLSVADGWSDSADVDPRASELAAAAVTRLDPVVAAKERTLRVPNSVVAALGARSAVMSVAGLRKKLRSGSVTMAELEKVASYIASSKSESVYSSLGGDATRRWLHRTAKNEHVRSLLASIDEMAASDTEWIDPEKPHEFVVFDDNPETCGACGKPEEDPIHVAIEDTGDSNADALSSFANDPEITDAMIDSAHAFEPDPDEPSLCFICGRPEDDELHQSEAAPVTAAGAPEGFDYAESNHYFGLGDDPESTNVSRLVMFDGTSWYEWVGGQWVSADETSVTQSPQKIELDQESAETLAGHLVDMPNQLLELSNLYPIERNLFELAWNDLDWKLIDRAGKAAIVAGLASDSTPGIYTPQERSQNAERQARGSDGRFGGGAGAGPVTDQMSGGGFSRARLPQPLPLVTDVNALIDAYLQRVDEERQLPADDAQEFAEASPDSSDVRPLYLAIVDSVDTEAVLDVVALVPPAAGQQGADVSAFKRANGQWVSAPELLADLRGATPPPVVELTDDELVKNVLAQVDQTDASKADSPDQAPVEMAPPIQASAFPMWGPYGEIIPIWNPVGDLPVTAAGVPGVADTPSDHASVERLKQYWLHGEGAAKIRWGTDGDWTRCHRQLSKYLGPERSKGYCSILHRRATGMWPGDRRNQD